VRQPEEIFDSISDAKPDAEMIAVAEKIIERQEGRFDPSKFIDRYEQALKALIAEKVKGHKPVTAAEPEDSNVIDLMSALRASLKGKDREAPAKAAATVKTAAPARARAPAKQKRRRAG
jgi:DNA end-binding protein Ku